MNWPDHVPVGPLLLRISGVGSEELNEGRPKNSPDMTEALYDHGNLAIVHLNSEDETFPRNEDRVDNTICHEIIHAWEDLVLGHTHELSEAEIQSLGNALHQLLIAVLEANGGLSDASLEE